MDALRIKAVLCEFYTVERKSDQDFNILIIPTGQSVGETYGGFTVHYLLG